MRSVHIAVSSQVPTAAQLQGDFSQQDPACWSTPIDPLTGQPADLSHRAFVASREDIVPLLAVPKEHLSDVTVVAYHAWAVSVHRVAAIDEKGIADDTVVILTSVNRFSFAGMPGIQAGRKVAGSGIATWKSSMRATRLVMG